MNALGSTLPARTSRPWQAALRENSSCSFNVLSPDIQPTVPANDGPFPLGIVLDGILDHLNHDIVAALPGPGVHVVLVLIGIVFLGFGGYSRVVCPGPGLDAGDKLLAIMVTEEPWPASPHVFDMVLLLVATGAELEKARVYQGFPFWPLGPA